MYNVNKSNQSEADRCQWVVNLLNEIRIKQIALFVNGVDYSKKSFSDACMALAQGFLVPAYIGDEHGKILQLHFDKVMMD